MSKPASDVLFRLIKSLTPAEKRYFKLDASRHTIGEKNEYLKLFEAIEAMNNYEEAVLKIKFKQLKAKNSFAIAKNRLYDTILNSLDSFHGDNSIDVQLKSLLHYSEILYKKSLYDESYKMLQRAKKLSLKHERYALLLEVSKWEKKLIEKDSYTNIDEDKLNNLLTEDLICLEKLSNYSEFWNLKSKLFFLLNRHGKVRDSEEVKQFKTLIDNILLKNEDRALSFESHYLFTHIYAAYYFGIGDYNQSQVWLNKQLKLIESNRDFIQEEPNKYFAAISNLIYLCTQLNKQNEISLLLEKLHNIPEMLGKKLSEDLAIKLFSTSISTKLNLYLQTGDFDKALDLVPEIDNGLQKYKNKLNKVREAYFLFNVSVLYFAIGDLTLSLQWMNRLLNDTALDANQEIYAFARIFDLVVHLEMGNNTLLPYALKSVQRYLDKRKRMYRFETIFLDFISKMSKATAPKDIQNSYTHLYDELLQLKEDPFERTVFEYFDFIAWVESKVQKISFGDLIRQRNFKNGLINHSTNNN